MSKEEKVNPNVEKILTELKELRTEVQSLKQKPTPSAEKKEEKHEHWTVKDVLEKDCPECKKNIEALKALGKEELAKALKERANLDLECVECGTGVRQEEEECPTCHGKKARHRA